MNSLSEIRLTFLTEALRARLESVRLTTAVAVRLGETIPSATVLRWTTELTTLVAQIGRVVQTP